MQGTVGKSWTEQVIARRPSGVIAVLSGITARRQAEFVAERIPLVVLDPTGEPTHVTPSIGATNYTGAMLATRHLLDLGHHRIAWLGGNLDWPFCRARFDGFRAAMEVADIPIPPEMLCIKALSMRDGLAGATALLSLPQPPTAIVATNDLQAYGVYEAARLAGMRIPDDLSVIGFDDLQFTRWAGPPMTTVRQPLTRMGATAAGMVMALAAGERIEQRVELSTELVVRSSTGRPPS
jgi:DNA-binding LacI/PurR family transcriptional regulator